MPFKIIREDITSVSADALVNTTNSMMIGYSGVDYAIHHAAGKGLDEECSRKVPLEVGRAIATGAYDLDAKYIIHVIGPVYTGGDHGEKELLEEAYTVALQKAAELDCKSTALPLISAGTYGFPKDQVMQIAVSAITAFLMENEMEVFLCVFDKTSYEISRKLFSAVESYIDDNYVYSRKRRRHEIRGDNVPFHSQALFDKDAEYKTEASYSYSAQMPLEDIGELIKIKHREDAGFRDTLFKYIDDSGMTDVECYKKANISKQTFSKIKGDKTYHPSKETVLCLIIALSLPLKDADRLLNVAGYTFTDYDLTDVIVKCFIELGNYDIFEINETLFQYDRGTLGV